MTNTTSETPETPATGRKCRKYRTPRTAFVVAVALAAGLAGAFASNAISKGRGGPHGHFGHHEMMGMGFMGGPGFMGGLRGKVDPERMQRRAERMAERFARRIDATGEQQSKLIAIAGNTAKDVAALRSENVNVRKETMKLLTAPTIDRAALEKLRADQISRMDQISKRMSQGMTEAAEVLTPEQRQKVAERMEKRREHRRGWNRGEGRREHRGPAAPDADSKSESNKE